MNQANFLFGYIHDYCHCVPTELDVSISAIHETEKVSQMVTEMVVELIKIYFDSEQQNTVPKSVDETYLNVTGPLYGPS